MILTFKTGYLPVLKRTSAFELSSSKYVTSHDESKGISKELSANFKTSIITP